jgi:ribosomal protein S18 acetylase RimI-like enzyme
MPRSARSLPGAVEFIVVRQPDQGILERLVAEFYAESGTALDASREAAVRRALERLVADDSLGRAWVIRAVGDRAEHAGYVIVTLGFSIEHGGSDAFVDELYVRRRWRRRGFGEAAVAHAVDFCRSRGVAALHLEVERTNAGAAALYECAGFTGNDRRLLTLTVEDPSSGAGPRRAR